MPDFTKITKTVATQTRVMYTVIFSDHRNWGDIPLDAHVYLSNPGDIQLSSVLEFEIDAARGKNYAGENRSPARDPHVAFGDRTGHPQNYSVASLHYGRRLFTLLGLRSEFEELCLSLGWKAEDWQ